MNTLLLDKDGTGNDQLLATLDNFYIHGAVAGTKIDGVTNVDVIWSADGFARLVSRDDISVY